MSIPTYANAKLRRALTTAVKESTKFRRDWLAYKQHLKNNLTSHAEIVDGQLTICVCRRGRDCDGTRYEYADYVPVPGVAQWLSQENERGIWLDGPEFTWFARPSEISEGHYSDMGGWDD